MKRATCGMVVLLAISGCGAISPNANSSTATTPTSSPSASLDAFSAATPVDPATFQPTWYSSDVGAETVNGVDFDSPDHTIHCGIYDPYFPGITVGPVAPFVGCVPEKVGFEFPMVINDGYGYARATAITENGAGESAATWMSDQEFAQHANPLAAGTSITWSTVTCASVDGGIDCRNSSSGHGFFISPERYEVDREAPEQFDGDYVQDPSDLYYLAEGTEWLTPSGNVACAIITSQASASLECRAAEHSWTGTGVSITDDGSPQPTSSGAASFVAGQALAGSNSASISVLPYGHFVHVWDFRCVSLDTGLTCENWISRHGFTISKSKLETH